VLYCALMGSRRGVPRRLALAVLLLLGAGSTSGAQTRPLRTETAETAAAGTLVFETGFDVIADEPSYLTGALRTRWDGPLLRAVYSPADSVELDFEWVAAAGVSGEEGRGDVQSWDWGDVALRAKWRCARGGGRRPALGVRFGVFFPQTSFEDTQFRPLGIGPNTLRAFVEALVTQPVGRGRLLANAGLLLFDQVLKPHEQNDFLSYGVALEWPLGSRLTAAAEVAGRAGQGSPGADQSSEARAGVRYGRGRVRFDAAVRRGLLASDGTWGVTAGLAWAARPPR
jgi:hypothetical protein